MVLDIFGTDADGLHMCDGVGHDLILDRALPAPTRRTGSGPPSRHRPAYRSSRGADLRSPLSSSSLTFPLLPFFICSYLFQQSIRGTLLFTPGTNYGEDEEFTAQLILRAESTYRTNATAYYYRQHQASATHQTNKRSIIRRLSETKAVITRLNAFTDRLPVNEKTALQRRVAQLTMDYLYNIIRLTGSRHYLERKMEGLRQEGLFPLPDKDYTTKYTWFRRLSNSPTGISLLMRLIPLIQKEA